MSYALLLGVLARKLQLGCKLNTLISEKRYFKNSLEDIWPVLQAISHFSQSPEDFITKQREELIEC